MKRRCLSIVATLFAALSAHAQSLQYVSDELLVNLRTGESNAHAIVRVLPAGTALDVLERNEDTGYARVRMRDRDLEGFVLSQYLTSEPIARDRLAAAERALEDARADLADFQMRYSALTEDAQLVSGKLEQTEARNAELAAQLADVRRASANAVALRDRNIELEQLVDEQSETLERLRRDNESLASDALQNSFLTGAGVLLGGIVLGLVLPNLRRRRRSGW